MSLSHKIIVALLLIQVNLTLLADDEPGGYVEPGGYDPVAEAAKQKIIEHKIAEDQKKQQAIANKKAAARKLAIEQKALKPENMAKISDDIACIKAGQEIRAGKATNWQQEIKRRNLKLDTANAASRVINVGSSICDVYASFGAPLKVNRTVGRNYVRKQFSYQKQYIYTENDVVNSWQD